MNGASSSLVVFLLDAQRFALYLSAVDKVVLVVDVTPLAQAPQAVLGIVNVQGMVVPVFNMRQRFHLPEREILLTDRLIVAHTASRPVAMIVDAVADIVEYTTQQLIPAAHVLPDIEYVDGIVKLDDGLILIHHLDKFLSLEEEKSLAEALETS